MPTWSAGLSLRGPVGPSLLTGYGPPSSALGRDGDVFFNSQDKTLVGPKQNGAWPSDAVSLVGPSGDVGAAGTMIYGADGPPSDSQYADGSFFIDTQAGHLYGPKQDGTWGDNPLPLVGPVGERGERGEQGDPGRDGATLLSGTDNPTTLGNPGDYFLRTDTAQLLGPRGSGDVSPWPSTAVDLRGPAGADSTVPGPVGPAGQDGKSLLSGDSDPVDGVGRDGEFWLQRTSGYLFGPKTNGHWPPDAYLLKGPPGDLGPVGPAGERGDPGPGFASVSGAPDASVGSPGSFCVDVAGLMIYGPKGADNATWPAPVSIVGPRGPAGADSTVPGPQGPVGRPGASLITGHGDPNDTIGNDGDVFVDLDVPRLVGPKATGVWPNESFSLVGPQGPVGADSTVPGPPGPAGSSGPGIVAGHGDPNDTVGREGDVFVDVDGARLFGAKSGGVWPSAFTSLVGPLGGLGPVGPAGKDGQDGSILRYGAGAPDASTTAHDGDFFIDEVGSRLFGPRQNGVWPSSYVSLVGPTGAQGPVGPAGRDGAEATLPNDITANSLKLAPVAGDGAPAGFAITNSAGTQVFAADAAGALTAGQATVAGLTAGTLSVTGASTQSGPVTLGSTLSTAGQATLNSLAVSNNATVGASLVVGGTDTAARFVVTSPGDVTAPMVSFSGLFHGSTGATYSTGFYSESVYGQLYEAVGSYTARAITYVNGPPRDNGSGYITHNAYTSVTGARDAHRWYVGGSSLALKILGTGDVAAQAGLSVAGTLSGASATFSSKVTAAGVALSAGQITFADGSVLASAPVGVNVGSSAAFTASSAGTAASPAFSYAGATKGAGLFFDGQGNVSVSVNGAQSLYSTAAAGAASGQSGWAIASGLGAGSSVLALYGSGNTSTPVASIDGAGALSAGSITSGAAQLGSLTLSSGGVLIFGDGTTMSTAASGTGGGTAGPAGAMLRYGTGAPTTVNPAVQNDGDAFIQTDQNMLWGPRQNGVWPSTPVSLIGPSGPAGPAGPAGNGTRSMMFAGSYWATAYVANTPSTLQSLVQSGTTVGQTPQTIGMPRAGSVTGYSFNQVGAVAGMFTLTVQKNGVTLLSIPNLGSGAKNFVGALPAGAYPFAAGDVLNVVVSSSGAGNFQCQAYLEIQTNA